MQLFALRLGSRYTTLLLREQILRNAVAHRVIMVAQRPVFFTRRNFSEKVCRIINVSRFSFRRRGCFFACCVNEKVVKKKLIAVV